MADDKSLGELLYEAMAEPFAFTGRWNPERKPLTCDQYERAARAFAQVVRERDAAAGAHTSSNKV